MSTTLILLAVALLLLVWFIYNQKVKFGVAAEEANYTPEKTYNYTTVRRL